MASNVELLPMPKHSGKATDMFGQKTKLYSGIQMQDYALANVEHHTAAKDAEIKALRAEVAEAREGWHMANGTADLAMKHRDAAEARAERLAEALRKIEFVEVVK